MNRRLKLLEKLRIFLVPVQVHSSKFFRLTELDGRRCGNSQPGIGRNVEMSSNKVETGRTSTNEFPSDCYG